MNIVRFEVLTSVLVMRMQCCVARLVVPDISKKHSEHQGISLEHSTFYQ